MKTAIETVPSLQWGLHRPGSETVIRMNGILKMVVASRMAPCPRIEVRQRQWKSNSIWIFQSNPKAPNVTHEKNIRSMAKNAVSLLSAKGY
jgi:hypothetical protein